ncbi:uncharacterized protein DUF222 [Blastococcus colisei]|uniref:Uncharacterized protein DUF222 n=1 Tax=Blastococcus colisei TaxID=1564162 RepID=A0A543P9C7_9ACTN|nr:HNH endonuclease signature motif containing protein [Blastococcus colisei]TQN40687.1 uncharacterized protein DUF222 [Blastococcus colisei]
MSSWVSVLEQLAELDPADFDPDDLSDEQLRGVIPLAQIGINRLTAMQTRAVGAGDARQVHTGDGMASMKPWLTGHCRVSGREAAGLVRAGRRLRDLPALAAAYAAGAVTPAHVAVVTTAVTPERVAKAAGQDIDLGWTDQILTDAALALGPEDTAQAVRRWVAGIDPDGTLDDAAGLPRVFRMATSAGGRTYLSGHLDPVGAETVHTALEAVMNGHRPAGDRRSSAERQGDALVELCRQALHGDQLPDVRGQRPHVRVTIDWMALCAERGMPGFGALSFGGPISAETARRIACDAGVSRILTGPNSLPTDVGREQRTAPAGIRRAIEERDLHCVFTGCTAPPAWCDVHHVDHWAWGGETSCDNGALICERHHTAVHEGGFRVARDPGTTVWHTYRPDGSEIRIRGSGP